MTRPIYEPSPEGVASNHGYAIRQLQRRPASMSRSAIYHIKVFSDTLTVSSGDSKFILSIPQDLDGWVLADVEISVTTVSSSGIVQVQIRNITDAVDILSTRVQIDASEFHSKDSATQPVVNTANDDVAHGDRLAVDVDSAGTGAKGLEVVLTFSLAA